MNATDRPSNRLKTNKIFSKLLSVAEVVIEVAEASSKSTQSPTSSTQSPATATGFETSRPPATGLPKPVGQIGPATGLRNQSAAGDCSLRNQSWPAGLETSLADCGGLGRKSVVELASLLSSSLMGSNILDALCRLITVTNCGGTTSVMNLAMRALAMAGIGALRLS
nr:hypothetical protein Iba_chr05aCG7110 [Ipomoea batatas]